MENTYIHLIRHGEVHNPRKILYGRLPRFRLSDNGVRQAKETGNYLKPVSLQGLFSSPLLRARQTAAEIGRYHPHLKLRISDLINEVDTAYEGVPGAQIDRKRGDIYSGVGREFEQPNDIVSRVHQFLNRLRRQFAGKHVAAVSHGDVITFTVLWAKGWALTPINKTRLQKAGYPASYPAHASVTTLMYASEAPDAVPVVEYVQPWR